MARDRADLRTTVQPDPVAFAPLFERLIDQDPTTLREPRPFRTHGYAELLLSVLANLERLLNTRALPLPTSSRSSGTSPLTIIDFGMIDLSGLSPGSVADQHRLCEELRVRIEAFEPRLRDVRVELEAPGPGLHALTCRVLADLVVEHLQEPVAFSIRARGAEWRAEEDIDG